MFRKRVKEGTPTGGQFAATQRGEAEVDLAAEIEMATPVGSPPPSVPESSIYSSDSPSTAYRLEPGRK